MRKILVVDNEESMQAFYKSELTAEGYEVIAINDCLRVFDLIQQEVPDLVVMDIKPGRYDGLELLREIRSSYYNLPVIVSTTQLALMDDVRSMAADYCVPKNTNLNELKLKIEMALEADSSLPLTAASRRMPLKGLEPP